MRDGQIDIGVSRRVIDPGMEGPTWLKKLGSEFNLSLNIHRANRGSELHNLIHKLLLRRSGKIHSRLRTEPRIEEINVVLDSNFLNGFPGEMCSFLR
jgi:hypothetical protein